MKKTPLLFRQSPLKSWRMWKEGFQKLTPLDHTLAKRNGHFWAVLGASMAAAALVAQIPASTGASSAMSKGGFALLVGGIGYLQFVEWRKEEQKVKSLKKMEEQVNGIRT